jgi:predicted ATPase
LQDYIANNGGANALLHCGAAITPQLSTEMTFRSQQGTTDYHFRLFHAASDTLIFADEASRFARSGSSPGSLISLGSAHRESMLIEQADSHATIRFVLSALKNCVVYQFHNTSETARMRQKWPTGDNWFLKEDAANVAPFLLGLQTHHPKHYRLIVETIRQIMPFFLDFELQPFGNAVVLQWRERQSDMVYSAHQASDGMLRLIALLCLLLQPVERFPSLLVLDEPELGLHPYAIGVIAGLIRSASRHAQLLVATQSTALVDYFDPEDIVVVDRDQQESGFRRLEADPLKDWLSEYSLSELWEKNVIGGRP